jgi:putative transposase
MRDELLNETWFFGLDHARAAVARRAIDCNQARPHSALAYQTPAAVAAQLAAMGGRLHKTDAFRRMPIAPSAQAGNSQPPTLALAG